MKNLRSNTPPLPQWQELHGLDQAGDLAIAATTGLFAGAAVGAGVALYLLARNRSWTWSLIGLPVLPASLLVAFSGVLSTTTNVFCLAATIGVLGTAIGWGVYQRVEDRRAGADRETAARDRRGVFDALRGLIMERGPRRRRLLRESLPLGRTNRGELALVRRGTADSGSHVLIPGATGAGKSTSLAALLVEYVVRSGFGAVVLEAKTDRALYDSAKASAAARNVAFHFVSPLGPSGYDPLVHGSADERSERLVAVESWGSADADFYRQAASPFLRLVIRALDQSRRQLTLATVARYCDPDELENLAIEGEAGDLIQEVAAMSAALRADERRAIAGLRARLRNLAESEFARAWLDPDRPGTLFLDLRDAIRRREVVYFRFDTDRTGNVGRAIAQMVLLDLGAAASMLMGSGVGTFVAVDEFGALEASALDRLYARGRAAGFSVAVGTQTLADLRAAGPSVRARIGATVESIVCHRIGEQADAEWVAQLIGTVPSWQTTIRADRLGVPTDEGTKTRGYRFEVHPSHLQRLKAGEVYVARLDDTSAQRSRRAQVVPPWERLPKVAA